MKNKTNTTHVSGNLQGALATAEMFSIKDPKGEFEKQRLRTCAERDDEEPGEEVTDGE